MTAYQNIHPYILETIPEQKGMAMFLLTYPGPIVSFYNYIYIIILSSNKSLAVSYELSFYYIVSQYAFHFLYFTLFASQWNVIHRSRYWKIVARPFVVGFVLLHAYLFSLLHKEQYILGPILSFYMTFYWTLHLRCLQGINDVLDIENEQN